MAETTLTVNGIGLNVVDEGEGDPILFLHGFPDSSYLWRNQIAFLSERGFRCVAPDLRGFGASDKPEGVENYGLMTVVSDLVGILNELGIERTHVVGHDWGAAAAWLFAIFQAPLVDQLVAVSVGRPGVRRRSARELRNLWYMFMFNTPEAEEAIMRDDWQLFRESFGWSPDFERSLSDLQRPGALTAGLNMYRANIAPAILLGGPMDFPKVTVPTMGIWSALDFALSEEQMTESEAAVDADWRYERIEGVSHWIPTEAPDRLNELLLERLKR